MTAKWRRYLRFWRPDLGADVDDEIAFHVHERIDDLVARGMNPAAARDEAMRLFGDLQRIKHDCLTEAREREADMRRIEKLEILKQDTIYALRLMRAHPSFTGAIALTLALGIGATTAIFSVVNSVLLRPLPYQNADRIVRLAEMHKQFGRGSVSPGHYTDWATQSRSFETLALWQSRTVNLTDGDPERARGARVTPGFFKVFYLPPAAGRYFLADETADSRVVVLSHMLWSTRFASDPAIVGKQITLSGEKHTVVGVTPAAFGLSTTFEDRLWTPFTPPPNAQGNYGSHFLTVLGKLKPGVSVKQADADIAAITAQIARKAPDAMHDRSSVVISYRDTLVENYEKHLWVLLGAVTFVLLIGCANVASLLLARASSRHKEFAIRAALGGARSRLVRQLLTESTLMAIAGGLAGLMVAKLGIRFLVKMGPEGLPRLADASLSWDVLTFAAGATVLCGVIFGIAPALRASANLQSPLRDGGRGSRGVVKDRVRSALIVTEMAVALLLLVCAGLLIRSTWLLQRVQPGFDAEGVTMMRVALPQSRYESDAAVTSAYSRIVEGIRGVPGVELAAAGSRVPMWGGSTDMPVRVDGKPYDLKGGPIGHVRLVTDGYFETIGIRITRGRSLQPRDLNAGAPSVIVVNETFAKRTFGNVDPIGHRISGWTPDSTPEWREIVGVSADVRAFGRELETPPEIYMPMTTAPVGAWPSFNRSMTIVAKTALGGPIAPAMRAALRRVDAEVAAYDVQPMEEVLDQSTATQRFNTFLLSTLGLSGLILAAIGIYGVIAFFVSQRTHEIGVRIALGASAANVVAIVVRHATTLAALGIAIGGLAAYWATSALSSMLFGVTPRDALVFVVGGGVLLLVAIGAAFIPARRAARVPPIIALTEGA